MSKMFYELEIKIYIYIHIQYFSKEIVNRSFFLLKTFTYDYLIIHILVIFSYSFEKKTSNK